MKIGEIWINSPSNSNENVFLIVLKSCYLHPLTKEDAWKCDLYFSHQNGNRIEDEFAANWIRKHLRRAHEGW